MDDVDAIAFARSFPSPTAACVIRRLGIWTPIRRLIDLPGLAYDIDDSDETRLVPRPRLPDSNARLWDGVERRQDAVADWICIPRGVELGLNGRWGRRRRLIMFRLRMQ